MSSLLSYDIVIVGAGPAGSTAAKTASDLGVKVLLIEEHPQPGTPVFCGEGVSAQTLIEAGLKPEYPIISQAIRKSKIYTPNGKHIHISNESVQGYIINREIFDKSLTEYAVAAGAELLVNTRAYAVTKSNGVVDGVEAHKHNPQTHQIEDLHIKAKIVIGADGHASTVRKTALGIPYFKSVWVCAQYTLSGLNIQEPDAVEIWLSRKHAPGDTPGSFLRAEQMPT